MIAAVGASTRVIAPETWSALDQPVLDLLAVVTPPPARDTQAVTVVLLDDESLVRLGARWPLPRATWATFLSRVAALRPRAVAIDAWFETPAPSEATELALDVSDEFRMFGLDRTPEGGMLAAMLESRAASLDGDRRMAEALSGLGVGVLGTACAGQVSDALQMGGAALVQPLAVPTGAAAPTTRCEHVAASIPPLAVAARDQGSLHVETDADGVIRRYPFWYGVGEATLPSLAAAIARVVAPDVLRDRLGSGRAFAGGTGVLRPIDPTAWRRLRFSDVLEAPLDAPALAEAITGRVVFVGVSAQGTEDLVLLPVAGPSPGVFVHAAAWVDLFDGQVMDATGPRARSGAGLATTLLLLLGLGMRREQRASRLLPATLGAAAAWIGLAAVAHASAILLPVALPLAGILGWGAVRLGFAWRRADLARRRAAGIRDAFAQYVAPEVVEELVRQPERLRLGGRRRVITAFFSDLQGFTALSEAMDPADLVALLNLVLGAQSDAIVAEGGIIDKYIGDAVVAIFGAPVARDDHAAASVRAALACQRWMTARNAEAVAEGRAPLRVRIGLNTGEAVVGNMGSAQRFDYTMLGDTVNLAARLEGTNAVYGTSILVGPGTREKVDDVLFREVDAVRVKGRRQAVTLYEPVAPLEQVTPAQLAAVEAFHAALADWRAGDWAACARGLAPLVAAGDPVAATFQARIDAHGGAPPPGWDPVFHMTTK
jgi:adenylate cyclase